MLTEQRKIFVDEYIKLKCKNAKQAAINAGYSPKTAQSQASQLLKDTNVLEYLNKRRSEIVSDLQQEFIYDALEAKKVMYQIMTSEDASDKDRIVVAKDFLDRAGFKPKEKIDMEADFKAVIVDDISGAGDTDESQ